MLEETPGVIIGRKVRRLRDAGLWTRDELAAMAGVSRQAIAHLELGLADRPRRTTIEKLSGALGVDIETLLEGVGDEDPKAEARRWSETEERRAKLEEVGEDHRDEREGLERYVFRWERWIEIGGVPEAAVREFLTAARTWYPVLRGLVRTELTQISGVLGLDPSPVLADEAKAESALLPLLERYGALWERLAGVWAERHPEDEGQAPADLAARRDETLRRTAS
jgi:transcriptional regulator with XRE-family HTH domain